MAMLVFAVRRWDCSSACLMEGDFEKCHWIGFWTHTGRCLRMNEKKESISRNCEADGKICTIEILSEANYLDMLEAKLSEELV